MSKIIKSKDYRVFLEDIKQRIRKSQYEALKAVNKELILLYWDIGRKIVSKQTALGWGKSVVENLAKDLQKEFPGVKGFSVQNLWYMRQFYLEYYRNTNLQPLVGEISWTHEYTLYKIKTSLPKRLSKYLPSSKELARQMEILK